MRAHLTFAVLAICSAGQAHCESVTLTVEIWADNWFSAWVNGAKVGEDSVPITTERSFNAEEFSFTTDVPGVIGFVVKDFKENDTGLEYIGSRKQQMGDGGVIAQIKDASGNLRGVTDSDARCVVLHRAPLNTDCADARNPVAGQGDCEFETVQMPDGWSNIGFDDSAWPQAVVHSERAVRPKDGYDRIDWVRSSRIIWSEDLERDNTLLCRVDLK